MKLFEKMEMFMVVWWIFLLESWNFLYVSDFSLSSLSKNYFIYSDALSVHR